MNGRTWERLEELFEQARGVPEEARPSFLDRACPDRVLRGEVEALLAAAGDDRALAVERLVVDARVAGPDDDPWLGLALGPWRLVRLLGHGGMGLVYGASRIDGQYQLDVAVKLMRAGPQDPYARERFRTERQVLASLKHPNIASLLDGGFASDGTPYLVMELVEGAPITDWCRGRRLGLEARLALFRVVCDAVQHAHQALVVHRDLKPTNILVSTSGDVKLLDFGIAKLLEPAAWGLEASATRTEMRALTPDYAAPEQWHGQAITTATDVYALGVLLYELVTGLRPRAAGMPQGATLTPGAPTSRTPPSEAVRRSDPLPEAAPGHDRRKLARRIRGDLDRIVLRALREEADRRYGSAGQLGEEVGRFLEGRAVLAQPDTVRYRIRKFVGRNRLAVLSAAVLVASLATFAGVSARQARVLAEQRRVAQQERDTSDQVVRLLIDLFEATNPSVRPDGDRMPIGEFLQGAQARSLEGLRDQPAVRSKLQQVFGLIHHTRGQYAPARQALEEALEEQRRRAGPDDPEALRTLQALGEVAHVGGDEGRARALLDESVARHLRIYGGHDPRTARALFALAPVLAIDDLDGAGRLLHRALDIRRAALGPRHPDVAESLAALGGFHVRRAEYEEAGRFYGQALALLSEPKDRRSPLAISILNDYGTVLTELNAHAEAEALAREALELGRQVVGEQSLTVVNLLNSLGTAQAFRGRHREAEGSFRAAHDGHVSLMGEGHWRSRNVARNVGRSLTLQRRHVEALAWLDRSLAAPVLAPEQGAGQWGIRAQRAHVLFRMGRRAEALAEAQAAVAALERRTAADVAAPLAAARVILGRLLAESGRPREAEAPLLAAADWLGRLGPAHPQRAEATCELARARLLQEGAAQERQRLKECLAIYRAWGLAEREVVEGLEAAAAPPPPGRGAS
jgi:eukaryotic-like serine/threonine-protein kinase